MAILAGNTSRSKNQAFQTAAAAAIENTASQNHT
jgi:hypothetical protein